MSATRKVSTSPQRGATRAPKRRKTASKRRKRPASSNVGLLILCLLLFLVVVILTYINLSSFLRRDDRGKALPPQVERGPPKVASTTPSQEQKLPQLPEGPDETLEKPEELPPSPPVAPPRERLPSTRNALLFYASVNDKGAISLESLPSQISFDGAPLTESIRALLQGPSQSGLNRGLISLIPKGAALLSAEVVERTAFLNFSEAFRFNSLGIEGYLTQLRQIVYTATEFPSIERVQIVIEGALVDYLGGEGVYVGAPLDRRSF